MPSEDNDQRQLGMYYAMAQVGIEMVAPIGLGWWLDYLLGTGPWIMIVGVLAGFTLGIWRLVKFSNKDQPRNGKSP